MSLVDDSPFVFGTPEEQAAELVSRAKALRLAANLTQVQMAGRTGMSANAYRIFERTGKTSLVSYLAVVQALRRSRELEPHLAPAPLPVEEPRMRLRARAKKRTAA